MNSQTTATFDMDFVWTADEAFKLAFALEDIVKASGESRIQWGKSKELDGEV